MDAGLKPYGGALFASVRDAGEPIFKSLPPPTPPPKVCPICGDPFGLDCTEVEMARHIESHFGGPPAAAAPVRYSAPATRQVRGRQHAVQMADYYEGEGGGCFGRGSTVLVQARDDNDEKFVRTDVAAVQPGDRVAVAGGGVAAVACVVVVAEPQGATLCSFPSGLRITAKHPIRAGGVWQRPIERSDATVVPNEEGFVVNFVLRGPDGSTHGHGLSLLVDGVECAALGHGLSGSVIGDDFYGTARVVNALAAEPGWGEGRVAVPGLRAM